MNAATPGVDRGHGVLTLVLAVLALTFAVLPPGLMPIRGEPVSAELGKGLLQPIQWPLLFLLGVYLFARRWRLALALLPWITWGLPLLLGWFLASTLWSVAPADTARQAVRLCGLAVCAFAWTLASWQPGRYWRLVRYTLALLAAGSVLVALALPEFGTHGPSSPEAGKWRGLTTNKNLLGAVAGIGLLLWLQAWAARELPLRRVLPWLAICLVALLGARSSASLFATLLACAMLLTWLRSPVPLRGWAVPVLVTLLVVVALPLHVYVMWSGAVTVTDVVAPLAELAGKDVSLSGRDELWRYLFAEIPRHPWIGLGHGAFWLGEFSASAHAVRELYWAPNQGHNFYLDLLNETGIVGVTLFALLLAGWVRTIVQVNRFDRPLAALNGALLVLLLVHSLAETALVRAITPMSVLMFFALSDMSRRRFEEALRARLASARGAQPAQAVALQHHEQRHQQAERGRQHHALVHPGQR